MYATFTSCFLLSTAPTTDIYTLSLHDALPIYARAGRQHAERIVRLGLAEQVTDDLDLCPAEQRVAIAGRSEEHTSELQSHSDLVCRLLLEKKKIVENQ